MLKFEVFSDKRQNTQMKILVMRTTHYSCYKKASCMFFLYFASEKFAIIVSMKDRIPFVRVFFYKNNDCATVSLQKFRTLKDMKKGVGSKTAEGLEKNDSEV